MISISVDFKDREKFKDFVRYVDGIDFVRAEAEVMKIAEDTIDNMKQTINTERKNPARPDQKLETALGEPEEVLNDPGKTLIIGIVDIDKMKQEAPYYEMINSGATYVTKKTHVVPTTYFAEPGTGFVTFKEGSSHTIVGIQYIDKALNLLEKRLNSFVVELGGRILDGMEK